MVIRLVGPNDNKLWYTANRDLLGNEGSLTIYPSVSTDCFMRFKKNTNLLMQVNNIKVSTNWMKANL